MPFTARLGDLHTYPMQTPMPPPASPVPQVGGHISIDLPKVLFGRGNG
jgi:hypothetical protein